jgi:hypothetical protein
MMKRLLLCGLLGLWSLTALPQNVAGCQPGDACYADLINNQLVRAGIDEQTAAIKALSFDQPQVAALTDVLSRLDVTLNTMMEEEKSQELTVNLSEQHHTYPQKNEGKSRSVRAGEQIRLDVPIKDYYHPDNTVIKTLLITVPDPRIPRLKRDFDITTHAIISAFSKRAYSLDRYSYPWDEKGSAMHGLPDYQQLNQALKRTESKDSKKAVKQPLSMDFGLLTFRKDENRECQDSSCGTYVIAVYLVSERPTTGVPVDDLTGAIIHASLNHQSEQPADNLPDHLMSFLHDELLIIGPTYSGSVHSLMAVDAHLNGFICEVLSASGKPCDQQPINVWSPTATAESNSTMNPDYRFLAPNDSARNRFIRNLVYGDTFHQLATEQQAAVIEDNNSTGICLVERSTYGEQFKCPFNFKAEFSPSIWEVGLSYQAGADDEHKKLPNILAGSAELQFGRDGGNEFPRNFDANITGRSRELQIQRLATLLSKEPSPIRYVLMVASDVKDRLFLSRFTKNYLPNSQLIFIESDILLSHPGYMDATRGAWMISGTELNLTPSEFKQIKKNQSESTDKQDTFINRAFSTETSAQFYSVIYQLLTHRCLSEGIKPCESTITPKDKLNAYVVSRDGFRLMKSETVQVVKDPSDSKLITWISIITLSTLGCYMILTRLITDKGPVNIPKWITAQHNPMLWYWLAVIVLFLLFITLTISFLTGVSMLHFLITGSWFMAIYLIRPWSRENHRARYLTQLLVVSLGLLLLFWFSSTANTFLYQSDGIRATDAFLVAMLMLLLTIMTVYRGKQNMFNVSVIIIALTQMLIWMLDSDVLYWHPISEFQGRLAFSALALGVLLATTLVVKATFSLRKIMSVAEHHSHLLQEAEIDDFSCIRCHFISPIMAKFHNFEGLTHELIVQAHHKLAKRIIRFRRELLMIMICPLSIVLMVYLTPVYVQNNFLLIGLALLVFAAAFSCFSLIRIDGHPLLRQLYCLKGTKNTLGIKLFAMVLLPVMLIAIGLAIVFIPGVAVWTDGFLMKLIHLWVR